MMKIITISRQFGSGGRELGKRLADELGFDYYDKEIISAIAQKQGLDEQYIETALNHQGWRSVPLTFRRSFSYLGGNNAHVNLLVEEKKVIENIAKMGKDCVIVGRNADILLAEEKPFNIFVCADMQSKVRRCKERAEMGENLSDKEVESNIRSIDKNRAKTRKLLTDSPWGESETYHVTLNTTDWEIKELVPAVKELAMRYWEKEKCK